MFILSSSTFTHWESCQFTKTCCFLKLIWITCVPLSNQISVIPLGLSIYPCHRQIDATSSEYQLPITDCNVWSGQPSQKLLSHLGQVHVFCLLLVITHVSSTHSSCTYVSSSHTLSAHIFIILFHLRAVCMLCLLLLRLRMFCLHRLRLCMIQMSSPLLTV